jgi:site-specific DNA-methyltransferase (adenine-specific)
MSLELPRNTILIGDATEQLRALPGGSVDCVMTSPPYYQLRNYDAAGQLGLESSVEGWVTGLRQVMRQVARVLKPSGALWLNLGDSFSRHHRYGAPPKALLMAPERLLLTLAEDGWLLRNKVIWSKSNPMPSSTRDRLTLTWEVVYFLVRSPSYYFDLDAVREPHISSAQPAKPHVATVEATAWAGPLAASRDGLAKAKAAGRPGHPLGKNPGDVWRIATSGYRGAHFATFPTALVRRPILATCPKLVCSHCGRAWEPVRAKGTGPVGPSCRFAANPRPGVVLDPFLGSGTVGVVAQDVGRDWLGIELNSDYAALARQRLGMMAEPVQEMSA